jgi:5-methyltetrahydropteroyltriglutamate--homocysteine methyltransferase
VAPPEGVTPPGGDGRDLPYVPDASFDGGELDCGSGLLLLIRRHIDPLAPGRLLELRSREKSVEEDLPAWCRMTGNELVHHVRRGAEHVFLVAKGAFVPPAAAPAGAQAIPAAAVGGAGREARAGAVRTPMPAAEAPRPVVALASLPAPAPAPAVPPLAVFGVGSWPRPRWMLRAIHERLEGRMSEEDFQATADDAVRLAVEAQLRAGVDVVTDGEQRRDSYASFVGARLDNCQLVPVTDLLPYVEDPAAFARELRALDVPAEKVRHPAVFGRLSRPRPLARHEAAFVRTLTDRPVKVALPGPYLLTQWMECVSAAPTDARRSPATSCACCARRSPSCWPPAWRSCSSTNRCSARSLRGPSPTTFMCGALDARRDPVEELALAARLLGEVTAGMPRERLALHVCRGNWTPDERAALTGDYAPLLPFLAAAPVGMLVLEACTHRAGALEVLADLPRRLRIGVGVLDQKSPRVESVDEVHARVARAVALFGEERVVLHPDCGFATFADNPIASAEVAEGKLRAAVEAVRRCRGGAPGTG